MASRSELLESLTVPIVLAPMAGGPSTPALAAAVATAGGAGFLAAGYRSPDQLRADLAAARAATTGPVGVNLFVPGPDRADPGALAAYAERIAPDAAAQGAEVGTPAWSDDGWDAKLDVLRDLRPPVASFTFGCPSPGVIRSLQASGIEVWVTVTEPQEAIEAAGAGADALVVQGFEAGGHRGGFDDRDGTSEVGLLALLRLCARATALPLVAAGGLADGWAIAGVLAAGARAAQVGTAFLDTDEAGTSPAHRERLRAGGPTRLTRAFSGRRARGLANRFLEAHTEAAPAAYPQVNAMTSPLRAAARARGDAEVLNLWAGQAHALAQHGLPAAAVMERLEAELREALGTAPHRLRPR